jgi:NAD(P)H-hydrate epimerase
MPIERIDTLPPLPARPIDGHKGTFGRVLVIGGSDGMIGAPVLAGTSALRMGSGLVQIAVPRAILHAALSITPELIGLGLGMKVTRDLLDAIDSADAVALGPGMGKSPAARERVRRIIRIDKPMVIDADALNILASQKRWPRDFHARAILTPHPGEMKRLAKLFNRIDVPADDDSRIDIAIKAATTFDQLIVLKGHRTVVTDGTRVYVNRTGDSSLSKAGSGDVLSGIIASLLGQSMERFDAACAGVYLHGKAGELAGKKLGRRCALAREIIDALPEAIAHYEQENG